MALAGALLVETLSSPSPIIAAFARTAGANVLESDVDDEKLDDNEDVGEGEEKIEDENHDYDDQLVNKRKRKLQQVVSITSRLTVINWMITDANQNDEQGLILRASPNFPHSFLETTRPIIPKPQGGGRRAIKLVNMAVPIQSRYQQLCHQFERGSTLRLLLAGNGDDLNGYPTCTSSCCPNSCGLMPLESSSLQPYAVNLLALS
uniref:Uncharacterized protein n=1 Tax=Hyaloperonospora arabidopsidis (strain Emoy2) TaxID=559515 RepID=M4BEB8_HYAAE